MLISIKHPLALIALALPLIAACSNETSPVRASMTGPDAISSHVHGALTLAAIDDKGYIADTPTNIYVFIAGAR